MAQRKIGILGGSFNPVHNAHLRLAVEAVEQAGLDRLDLVPAARPPHKGDSDLLPFSERCRFLELALRHRPRLELNPLEGKREGPSYTVDTLEEYLRSHPGEAIHFVLGGDEFLHLPTWHRWERIPQLAHILLSSRGEESLQAIREAVREHFPSARTAQEEPPAWTLPGGGSLQVIELPRMDISSSLIRERLRQGRSLAWLVPEAVEKELYGMRR
ncbi:MAG: nicotinate (nicotinamide) nucleotide adenylyltransferase [Desulfohalobiaceae bacterium]|nr:nicotinate (nicotinamide) nucleotide adenylyltransferase [Desulfohalobiaceae bacterium]